MPEPAAGQRLRVARDAAGLSRNQLAKITGVSVRTIARAELEGRLPKVDALRALGAALDLTLDEIAPVGADA